MKKQWPDYQKWAPDRAFEYLSSLVCAGLLFLTAAKSGGIRTDVLLLPQRFYEGAGETREEKQLVENNSNDLGELYLLLEQEEQTLAPTVCYMFISHVFSCVNSIDNQQGAYKRHN